MLSFTLSGKHMTYTETHALILNHNKHKQEQISKSYGNSYNTFTYIIILVTKLCFFRYLVYGTELILITNLYLYGMILMYSHIIHVFLSLYESILLRNWNHSNWIIQTKVMAFSCQTSQFTNFSLGTVCKHSFFRRLNFIPDPGSLYSFEAKVLRVHFQLESPKSEHQNSNYVLNNRG